MLSGSELTNKNKRKISDGSEPHSEQSTSDELTATLNKLQIPRTPFNSPITPTADDKSHPLAVPTIRPRAASTDSPSPSPSTTPKSLPMDNLSPVQLLMKEGVFSTDKMIKTETTEPSLIIELPADPADNKQPSSPASGPR